MIREVLKMGDPRLLESPLAVVDSSTLEKVAMIPICPAGHGIGVAPDVTLVVTEGNYLLVDQMPWATVRSLLDQCWYVEVPEQLRHDRLEARHLGAHRSLADGLAADGRAEDDHARHDGECFTSE